VARQKGRQPAAPPPDPATREYYRANLVQAEQFLAVAHDYARELGYDEDAARLQEIIATLAPMRRMA
jgi:hypothetical protein